MPTKRTASIGSRVPPAVTSTLQAVEVAAAGAERASTAASSSGGSGRRPMPALARRAERAGARLEHGRRRARAASRGSPAWRGARTSRRSWPERRSAVAGRRARRRSAGCRRARRRAWRACWRDAGAIRKTSARSTSARCESGACSGGGSPGKAPRSGSRLPLGDEHRRAGDRRRTRPARRSACDASVWIDAHGVAGLDGQPRELQRLVGGDPAADAEQDARHRAPLRLSRGSGT